MKTKKRKKAKLWEGMDKIFTEKVKRKSTFVKKKSPKHSSKRAGT